MNLHANSRTCPHTRLLLCRRVLERGWSVRAAAEAAGCSERTAFKWIGRYRGGDRELGDRSSRPGGAQGDSLSRGCRRLRRCGGCR